MRSRFGVVDVVGDFAADVAVFLVFFFNLQVEWDRRLGVWQRAHCFLHASEDVCTSLLPIGGRLDWGALTTQPEMHSVHAKRLSVR